ncbi:MAG: nuclear transport factor 2 family protein [Blautia sp.]|uniref:nuclear transport factor 2 family protein n=1 Tax=Blautia sp. TaxID=1955243 RepID=UPI00258AF701|nr:nuclear transport factor 2 family protein [Blautia sp.]MCI7290032.1 nuclear transport factor 2 family protein [Blautia sp.]
MDDFKKLTEQLMKIYSNAESVNDLGIENYFDENISLIGTGKHELFANLHEFLKSFKFDVKRRGKIRLEVGNLHQEEERLDDDHVLAHGTVDFTGLFKDGSICFKMETRFTIIYKWTNGKWLVQHLHQSTPDLEQMESSERDYQKCDSRTICAAGMNAHISKPMIRCLSEAAMLYMPQIIDRQIFH